MTLNPGFKVTVYLQIEYLKNDAFWDKDTKTLIETIYIIYRMVPLSMTLSDLWLRFQGDDIFVVECRKTACLKDKVTIAQEENIPNIRNGTMFGDLDWPLNASRGFAA